MFSCFHPIEAAGTVGTSPGEPSAPKAGPLKGNVHTFKRLLFGFGGPRVLGLQVVGQK